MKKVFYTTHGRVLIEETPIDQMVEYTTCDFMTGSRCRLGSTGGICENLDCVYHVEATIESEKLVKQIRHRRPDYIPDILTSVPYVRKHGKHHAHPLSDPDHWMLFYVNK